SILATIACVVALAGAGPFASAQNPVDFARTLALGQAAYQARRTDEAVEWFEKAGDLRGDSAISHLWVGRAYVQAIPTARFIRQPTLARRARSQFDRAIELEPTNFDGREARATYYMYAPSIAGGGAERARTEAEVARRLDGYRGGLLRAQIEEHFQNFSAAAAE